MSGVLILNVDDNPATRYTRTRVLQQAGFRVLEAGTASDALRMVRESSPQLVLMDVRLPDMSGIDACRRIKLDPLTMRTPVVQISATFVTESDQAAGLEGGAEVYLTEPVEPVELITVVRTLLRLRSAERGLLVSEERWRRLFGANVVGLVIVKDDRIVEANDLFLDMIGLSRAQIETQVVELSALTPPEFQDVDDKIHEELESLGSCAAFEKDLLRPDGERVRVLMGGTVLDSGHSHWLGFVLDIRERRRADAERELLLLREQEARREAERAVRLKDEFLANLSHELRTPMSTISGWLHLLRSGQLSREQVEHGLQTIERATRSQNQLIADLLDVSRIVAGKLSIERELVEVRSLIEASAELVVFDARSKGIETVFDFGAQPAHVMGDGRRLQQVFWNLLSNAVKFTPRGGRIHVRTMLAPSSVTVTVSDTGQGIPAEFLPHVFDRFRQADGSSSRRHGGMGLGLAIVRHVVDLHGGDVGARSDGEGKGSTFSVTLPRARLQDSEMTAESAPDSREPFSLAGIHVLLIEDDDDAREMAEAVLLQAGARCRSVASAVAALNALDHEPADVVISDIAMSEIDGYEFIRRLRAREADRGGRIPAVALTAFARKEDRERALASGYDAHVAKPIDPREILRTARDLALRRRG
jgi:PAS domain S-box-containing protein